MGRKKKVVEVVQDKSMGDQNIPPYTLAAQEIAAVLKKYNCKFVVEITDNNVRNIFVQEIK